MRSAGRSLPPHRAAMAGSDAVEALAVHLRASAEPATVLALGPLTNLAVLLQREPQLAARIGSLLWMGGSAGPGNHTAAAEFNAAVDPESVQVVLDAGVPFRMVGLDACRQVCMPVCGCAARGRHRAPRCWRPVRVCAHRQPDGSLPCTTAAAAALAAPSPCA
jgi:purine nucleosidase